MFCVTLSLCNQCGQEDELILDLRNLAGVESCTSALRLGAEIEGVREQTCGSTLRDLGGDTDLGDSGVNSATAGSKTVRISGSPAIT